MPDPSPDFKPKGRAELVFRQLEDEWVIFDPASNRLHALNLTGALIWDYCDGDRTLREIAEVVRDAFAERGEDVDVLADVIATAASFRAEGLLA
ncbi:MAG TPA: PqqD family protein [Gemmatimonadales bacterium]